MFIDRNMTFLIIYLRTHGIHRFYVTNSLISIVVINNLICFFFKSSIKCSKESKIENLMYLILSLLIFFK